MVDRIVRISEEVKKEISSILQNDIKDPRLSRLTSVVNVKVTKDLKFAKVFVSVLGNEEEKNNTLLALKSAASFIRREVGHRVSIRCTPEMQFVLDNSIEYGAYMNKLINDTIKSSADQNESSTPINTDQS